MERERKTQPHRCFALKCTGLPWGKQLTQAAHDIEARRGLEGLQLCVQWDGRREHRSHDPGKRAGVNCVEHTAVTQRWLLSQGPSGQWGGIGQSRITGITPKQGWDTLKDLGESPLCVLLCPVYGLGCFECPTPVLFPYCLLNFLSVCQQDIVLCVSPWDAVTGSLSSFVHRGNASIRNITTGAALQWPQDCVTGGFSSPLLLQEYSLGTQ